MPTNRIFADIRAGVYTPLRVNARLQPHRRALQPQRRPRRGRLVSRPDLDRPQDGHFGLHRHRPVGGRDRADADHQRGLCAS